jgi:hypothetical protein
VATAPNVLQYRGTTRHEHPTILVVLHEPVGRADREGRSPSKGFLDNGRDVREVVDICMVWQSLATQNAVELTLGYSHDVSVPSHCEEKTIQHRDRLEVGKNSQLAGPTTTRTVSDIPTGDNQGGWDDRKTRYTNIHKSHSVANGFHVDSFFVQSFLQTR